MGGHEHAHLEVTVVKCRQLVGEWKLHSNPYVVIRYGSQEHKTHADKHSGREPTFNQTLKFEVKEEPHVLSIEVKDNDPMKNETLAYGQVDFSKVITEDRVKGLFPLKGVPSGGHHGDIELDMKYTKSATPYHGAVTQ